MKYSTKKWLRQIILVRLQLWIGLSCLGLAVLGPVVESQGGWVSCPPCLVVVAGVSGCKERCGCDRSERVGWVRRWERIWRTWPVPLLRSVTLGWLWLLSGQSEPGWVVGLPWLLWLWQSSGQVWPKLRGQPEWRLGGRLLWQGHRLVLMGCLGLAVEQWLQGGPGVAGAGGVSPWEISLGCVVCGRSEPGVQVEQQSDGSYRAELCGHFRLQVAGDDPFRMRLMILFLRLLEVAGPERVIGRTRDDRAPFVRQMQVAEWFGVPQPNVSRWERYWLAGNWPDLLSEKTVELLTAEVRTRIVQVLAAFPWWGLKQVYHHLPVSQGLP